MNKPTIVWFRNDLRVRDNPALIKAINNGPIVPVYIMGNKQKPLGGASKWWLHHALVDLAHNLEKIGIKLILRSGTAIKVIDSLIKETGAAAVNWNRRYDPEGIKIDSEIKQSLLQQGVNCSSFNGSLLVEPWEITNNKKQPFKVYTPFLKAVLDQFHLDDRDLNNDELRAIPYSNVLASDELDSWHLLPHKPNWAKEFPNWWQPREQAAIEILKDFLASKKIDNYDEARNIPSVHATSRLSPYLAFGQISPKRIWSLTKWHENIHGNNKGIEIFLSEVIWREFGYHHLYHFPEIASQSLLPQFHNFPWRDDKQALKAWQKGQTGYPIVDAGMRELYATGWMHNRVRMITASFLIKHLLIDWQIGEKWFWDTLLDADHASNVFGWQWVAGSGYSSAPYFRIFNPIIQGERFDTNGEYVKRWIPELAKMPKEYIHQPWLAPEYVLEKAGIVLGKHYPKPIVDHEFARNRALKAMSK
jgi:deoxyribodipyrimidine photo-lyase